MSSTKLENILKNAMRDTPFSGLLQIQISPKQSCHPTAIQMENKLCSLLIGIVCFVLDLTPA